jgi:hypothetical protein
LGNFNHSPNSTKNIKSTSSSGSVEKIGVFSNLQGQPFEVITPSLSIYIDGGKPMWAVRGNNNWQFQSYIKEMATIPSIT